MGKYINTKFEIFEDANINDSDYILEVLKTEFGHKMILLDGDLNDMLPMTEEDWAILQSMHLNFPSNYRKEYSNGLDYIDYTTILQDVYGDDWYFDDVQLVQGGRTIVNVEDETTFAQLLDSVEMELK